MTDVSTVHLTPVATRAHAKINLSLRVLAREQSGYHQIETLFCALALADDIVIEPRDDEDIVLDVAPDDTGVSPDLGPMQQNLAWRAAELFRRAAPGGRGVTITLTKRIPHGAGLGGGSSDAAAVLRSLNALNGHPLADEAVLQLGAALGSDVPFFLSASALAFGWGRGNRLLPITPLPAATVLLAMPPDRVPTADAYAALAHSRANEARPMSDPALEAAVLAVPRTWREVSALAVNHFEAVVFSRIPSIHGICTELRRAGACLARMTGTGSAAFGVFEDPADAQRAQHLIARNDVAIRTIMTTTGV